MNKRILVSSIPSWNQFSGSDTWPTLLSSYDSQLIANIYIDGLCPDSKVASRYFHISEKDVIVSIIDRKRITGHEVFPIDYKNLAEHVNRKVGSSLWQMMRNQRCWALLWGRELAWKIGKWRTANLDNFVKDFAPDVFAFSIESYPYFNRINEYIIDKYKPHKVIAYLWDDNFTYNQSSCIIKHIERFFLRKQVRRLISKSTDVLSIIPKMKSESDREFGINSTVITKPLTERNRVFIPYRITKPIKLLYTGKLNIGRDRTLMLIADAINLLNRHDIKIVLDIFTNSALSEKQKRRLNIKGQCFLHEAVAQEEVLALQEQADVLLFVESLSEKNKTARLSFSTKLTDYLSAGKCIWAVGNDDLAPITYIKDYEIGLVSNDVDSIPNVLNDMLQNPSIINEFAEKAFRFGRKFHSYDVVTSKLEKIIES